ncbi:hypothetical protein FGKAn22_23110 [Ferrigenium kumadai]|uniref:Uncharacterized protein n=1 Tax=Ferrigenium kumadai TaxID=1682490 RepID=A0AAN1T0R9_9PROT|nr:hypothetical protein [Ferrigenium kumadai]BBJ00619.1 hypothetical protein FGKAn22_23110 [Ferrigenium kumadai]
MRRYLTHFLVSVLSLACMIAGFNWWIDPYGIYRKHEKLLERSAPMLIMNERVFKTVALARAKSDMVVLGSSRTDIGIGRGYPEFEGKRVLSLATFGQPIRETRQLMELAVTQGNPQTAILGLDFFAFNALFVPPSDYVEENYSPLRPYSLMLSVSTLSDSWRALRRKGPADGDCCYADGFRTPQDLSRYAGSYRQQFAANERMYLLEKYLPYPECAFSFTKKKGGDTLDDFREIVKLAHQHQVDLRLFVSPSHARQWETLAAAGLWDEWEDWKRRLVQINEEVALLFNRPPLPIWDFSGYDEVSGEEVPVSSDPRTMRWYTDSSHYTPELGRNVVQRMFSGMADSVPADWGARLNSDNLDVHLEKIRASRNRYRSSHAQDTGELEKVARDVSRLKHCPDKQGENS